MNANEVVQGIVEDMLAEITRLRALNAEMLVAMKAALPFIDDAEDAFNCRHIVEAVRALIAKAAKAEAAP